MSKTQNYSSYYSEFHDFYRKNSHFADLHFVRSVLLKWKTMLFERLFYESKLA